MANVLIGLGSNVGSREENLQRAVDLLEQTPGIDVRAVSRWLPTRPVGGPAGQPDFLNGVALLRTSLSPEHLLHRVQEIELQLGRIRMERWGPRSLDLDILLYEQLVIQTPQLRIPHPAMPWRRFVLEPAAQVAGWMQHPQIGWTVRELFDHLRIAFPYVAITGPYPALNTRLAKRLAYQAGADLVCLPGWLKVGLRRAAEKTKGLLPACWPPIPSPPHAPRSTFEQVLTTPEPPEPLPPPAEEVVWEEVAQPIQLAEDIVQWLHLLTERLPGHRTRRVSDGWVVSDFWLPHWLAETAALLGPSISQQEQKLWGSLAKLVAPPKLLVVLSRQADESACHGWTDQNLRQLGWQGPVLRIRLARAIWPPRLTRAASEVQTAMEGMQ